MGDEADALNDWSDEGEAYCREKDLEDYYKEIDAMKGRYDAARRAETKATILCPVCKRRIIKTTYHKVFCSNAKTHGKNNCKDKYWNRVDDTRRFRTKLWTS